MTHTISKEVNIEMLEKLPDGTYKLKYPKTRSTTWVKSVVGKVISEEEYKEITG